MKKYSSSKKKKILFVDDRSGEETATPRVKKSFSVTNNNYLQLQLDTSGKKRQNMEKNLQTKDKRIRYLQREVMDQQQYITTIAVNYKDMKHKWEHQRTRNQRTHYELQEAVDLCRAMKEKCRELMERNQNLATAENMARQKSELEIKKGKEVKELRKREKNELRQMIFPLLDALTKKNTFSPEELTKISQSFQ